MGVVKTTLWMVLCVENVGGIYPWIWVLYCQENLTSALALFFMFKLNGYQQLLSEVFKQKPPGNRPLLMWNKNCDISMQGEGRRVTTSQSHNETLQERACPIHRLDHGGNKLVKKVPDWPGVPGFCSDSQELEIWTWNEAERSKIQLACNYMPVQGLFAIPLLWLLTHNPSPALWRYLCKT